MMFSKKTIVLLFSSLLIWSACIKDDPENEPDTGYLHGAFVVNEGAFGNSNGSVSYFDTDSSILINHIFESVNGRPLGDVVQSIGIAGDKGFIVVNNSQKVEIVDLKTFASLGVIDGLEYPRHFLSVSDKKGYLTDGNFSGRVYVIDIASLKITDTIPCGSGPEKMSLYNQNLLVANSGGWGNDSTLTVINTATDAVTATWVVGDNPADLVLDKDNQLWVLCKGKVVWNADWTIGEETTSTLTVVNPSNGQIIKEIGIGSVGDYFWPQRMAINANKDKVLFLEAEGIYSIPNTILNASQLLIPGYFYGFGINPANDQVYALNVPSFTTSGWIYRHEPTGLKIDSLEVGIGPSQVVFN